MLVHQRVLIFGSEYLQEMNHDESAWLCKAIRKKENQSTVVLYPGLHGGVLAYSNGKLLSQIHHLKPNTVNLPGNPRFAACFING